MKKYIHGIVFLLLSITFNAFSQGFIPTDGSIQVTWPIENMVFQQSSSGNAEVVFTGQSLKGTYYTSSQLPYLKLKIQKYTYTSNPTSNDWSDNNNVPIAFNSCSACSSDPNLDLQLFYQSGTQLTAGWYRVALGIDYSQGCGSTPTGWTQLTPWKEFGVGDVYYVAGQSNASGFDPVDDQGLSTYERYENSSNPLISDSDIQRVQL